MRVRSFDLPDQPYPSPNQRLHHQQRARLTRAWREQGYACGSQLDPCDQVSVELHYWPKDRRRRDADNLVLVLKALCDGLVDAGVVPDDTPQLMAKRMPRIHVPAVDRRVRWMLRVTDLSERPVYRCCRACDGRVA